MGRKKKSRTTPSAPEDDEGGARYGKLLPKFVEPEIQKPENLEKPKTRNFGKLKNPFRDQMFYPPLMLDLDRPHWATILLRMGDGRWWTRGALRRALEPAGVPYTAIKPGLILMERRGLIGRAKHPKAIHLADVDGKLAGRSTYVWRVTDHGRQTLANLPAAIARHRRGTAGVTLDTWRNHRALKRMLE